MPRPVGQAQLPPVRERTIITPARQEEDPASLRLTKVQNPTKKPREPAKKQQVEIYLQKVPVQSIYLQNFEAQVAMGRLKEHSEMVNAINSPPFGSRSNSNSNSHFHLREYHQGSGSIFSKQRRTVQPSNLNSIQSIIASPAGASSMASSREDLQKLNLSALRRPGSLVPQHLNEVGGLPLPAETIEINQKLRHALAVDPLSKVKGSRAQLQAQYLEMQNANTNSEILQSDALGYQMARQRRPGRRELPSLASSSPSSHKLEQSASGN